MTRHDPNGFTSSYCLELSPMDWTDWEMWADLGTDDFWTQGTELERAGPFSGAIINDWTVVLSGL